MATKLTYLQADEMISDLLSSGEDGFVRRGVIDQILLCVRNGEGVEFANALVWKYELNEWVNGCHKWLPCDETAGPYVPNRYPTFVSTAEDYRFPNNDDNAEIEHLIMTGVE